MDRTHDKVTLGRLLQLARESLLVGMAIGAVLTFGLFFAASAGSDLAMVTFFSLATPAFNPFAFFMPSDLGMMASGLELGLSVVTLLFGISAGAVVFLWRCLVD